MFPKQESRKKTRIESRLEAEYLEHSGTCSVKCESKAEFHCYISIVLKRLVPLPTTAVFVKHLNNL